MELWSIARRLAPHPAARIHAPGRASVPNPAAPGVSGGVVRLEKETLSHAWESPFY